MEKFLIAIMEGYSNTIPNIRVLEVRESELPFDIQSGCRCSPLRRIPQFGEWVYLGDSAPHHFPSDVIVTRCDENIKSIINWCYEAPVKELAEFFNDPIPSELDENDYRDEAACYFFPNKKK